MVRMLAALVGLVLLGHPALAQQRIFAVIDAPDGLTNALWEAGVQDGRVTDVMLRTITPGRGGSPGVAAGGQIVVWGTTDSGLAVFDRTTGTTLMAPGLSLGVLDPTQLRLFTALGNSIVRVTPGGSAVLPGTNGLAPSAVSADGRRVYAKRELSAGPPALYEVVAVDPDSGAALGAIPIGTAPGSIAPAPDGTSVWVISARSDAPDWPLLRRFEWPSGEERVAVPLGTGSPPLLNVTHKLVGVDSTRRRVVVASTSVLALPRGTRESTSLLVLDTESGAAIGRMGLAGPGPAMLDRGAGEVLGISQDMSVAPLDPRAWLIRYSLETGQELSRQSLGIQPFLGRTGFAVPPRPPSLEAPVVSQSRAVTLSWARAPELTLGVTVEAGSAPGLANIATFPVTNLTTLIVPNVPPGTYYVRVRAWNDIGASVPSNEIVVTVP
jgi:hypothetical protein